MGLAALSLQIRLVAVHLIAAVEAWKAALLEEAAKQDFVSGLGESQGAAYQSLLRPDPRWVLSVSRSRLRILDLHRSRWLRRGWRKKMRPASKGRRSEASLLAQQLSATQPRPWTNRLVFTVP
jgi:hypothetical protein